MTMATISVLVIFFVIFDNWDEVTRGAGVSSVSPATRRSGGRLRSRCSPIALARLFRESPAGTMLRASRADL